MKSAIAITATAALAVAWTSPVQAETTLRFHTWASPKHHINSQIVPTWCRQVSEATRGDVKCKVTYPPKAPPPRMFDRARTGIADVVWGLHDYTPGRFKLAEIAELPYWNASSTVLGIAHWRTYRKYLAKASEHRGVKLLGLTVTTGGVFQTKFPLARLADLKGKKFRVSGGIAKQVAQRLSIVPVGAPAPKVYSMLQQGVVDGVLMPPETSRTFKLMEVTSHVTLVPEGLYYSSFFLVMNEKTWKKLSKKNQAAIEKVSGEAYARMAGKAWDNADGPAMAMARKKGVEIATASAAMRRSLRGMLGGIRAEWVKAANAKGVDGAAAIAYMQAQVKQLKAK